MSSRINTNTTALMASRNLNVNSDNQSKDIERLSTGLRINSAADDSAGLVISQNMNAQLVGLNQATSNTNDAINETKTAENALAEVQNLLMSMRQLAVNASNAGVNDTTNLAADQAQITSAIQSINRIAANTQFGTKLLLNGDATSKTTITAGSASVAGSGVTITSQGRWTDGNAYTYGEMAVHGATATVAAVQGVKADTKFSGSVIINGTSYGISDTANDLANLNTAIQSSGYTARIEGDKLLLTSQIPGALTVPQTIDTSLLLADGAGAGTAIVQQGQNAYMTLKDKTGHVLTSIDTVTNNDGTNNYSFKNGLMLVATEKDGVIKGTSLTSVSGVSTRGKDLYFQIGANQGQVTTVSIARQSADQLGLNTKPYLDRNGLEQVVATDSVADINVMTFKGAQDAIAVVDKALSDVSTTRANIGAIQVYILQSNVNSLSVASQNLSSSKSTITDADLASAVVQYTKDSILTQAGTSALAYANQMPQQILKLLQS
jgi:flagellin